MYSIARSFVFSAICFSTSSIRFSRRFFDGPFP